MSIKVKNISLRFQKRVFHYGVFCSIIAVICLSCLPFSKRSNQHDVISSNESEFVLVIDSTEASFNNLFAGATASAFYGLRQYLPFWIEKNKPTAIADSMIQIIRTSRLFGLLPQDYHLTEIESITDTAHHCQSHKQCLIRLDMLLTNAFFSMAHHLKNGRILKETLERNLAQVQPDSAQILLLNSVYKNKQLTNALVSQEPLFDQYKKLRKALIEILTIADSTEKAVLLSGSTMDSSATSLKVQTIETNLERWRWEAALKGRYLYVNIPAFRLDVVEHDTIALTSRVIVGTAKTQTPMLDGLVKSFTIFPYWHVTRNVAVNEILPKLKKDSTYLYEHHYEVLDINGNVLDASTINWDEYHVNNFPVMLRQREGLYNSLGLIKFTFNNPYAVYLHDTNARMLFKKDKRALSHGCVRVEKALELGRFLVKEDNVYCSPEDLDQYLELKKQLTIRVVNPIPVHIRYFTAEYTNDSVTVYKDIYNLDQPIVKAIYESPKRSMDQIQLSQLSDSTLYASKQ